MKTNLCDIIRAFRFRKSPFLLLMVLLFACKSGIESKYPMEKRYWGPKEYDKVVRTIRFNIPDGERLPEFKNPETAPVIKKLVDSQNFLVVLTDENLGVSHRNEIAQDFFNEYRNMPTAYSQMDRQDKFIYGMELVESYKFGLHLQLYYFKLGNENIIKNADNPEAQNIRNLVNSNANTIYKNFNNYLDYVNNEHSFNVSELEAYAEGIEKYFPMLIEMFPNGNKGIIKNKAELMFKKAENERVKKSIADLLTLIEAEKKEDPS